MADLVQLWTRHAPWKPSPESELIAQYRYYDVPLAGVIRQDDREYLFMCLDGEDETISVWWFTHITAEQRATLEGTSSENFDSVLNAMEFNGWSRIAFATTNLGIVDFEDVEDVEGGLTVALDALRTRLHKLSEDADQLVPASA